MAIASGLTCVDYLATQFHSPSYQQEELRYSPTLSYNDLYSNFLSSTSHPRQRYYESTLLEFTNLSLAETTFDFTTHQENKTKSNNSDFVTEYEKVKDILNTGKKSSETVSTNHRAFPPFSVNDDSCNCMPRRKSDDDKFTVDYERNNNNNKHVNNVTTSSFDSEDDEEIGAIFKLDSSNHLEPSSPFTGSRVSLTRTKSRSLPRFAFRNEPTHQFPVPEEDEEMSDSELELARIILPRTPPKSTLKSPSTTTNNSSNNNNSRRHIANTRKRRTSADATSQPASGGSGRDVMKRPCIDAEKMHRSMRRSALKNHRLTRRNLEKELFVPIEDCGKKL